jgi:hypothetical protein
LSVCHFLSPSSFFLNVKPEMRQVQCSVWGKVEDRSVSSSVADDDDADFVKATQQQSLLKLCHQLVSDVPVLLSGAAQVRTNRVLLLQYTMQCDRMQSAVTLVRAMMSFLRVQHSRLESVGPSVRDENQRCKHVANLLSVTRSELSFLKQSSGARLQVLNRKAELAAGKPTLRAAYETSYNHAVICALSSHGDSSISSETSKTEAVARLRQGARLGEDAARQSVRDMEVAVDQLEKCFADIYAIVQDDGELQWRDPAVKEAMTKGKQLLQVAGESISRIEKSRAAVEAEWKQRPADVVSLERNMMQMFWEDPINTSRLNHVLQKMAAGSK